MRKIGYFLIITWCMPLVSDENSVLLFSLDYLYPQRYFYQVESGGKELWSSIDILISEMHNRTPGLEDKVDSIYDQCKKVHKAVRNFVAHEKKSNMYLADDVKYLLGLFDCIQEKFLQLAQLVEEKRQVAMLAMYNLLSESKEFLDELLKYNQEITAS